MSNNHKNEIKQNPELKNIGDLMNAIKGKIDSYREKKSHTRQEKKQAKIALHIYAHLKNKIEEEPDEEKKELKPRYFGNEGPVFFFKTGVDENKVYDVVAVIMEKEGEMSMDRFKGCNAALERMLRNSRSYPRNAKSIDGKDGF
ncbi:MAG: hypothetical protein ACM3UU_00195 [Ignavibacteriales bacterium]